MANKPVPALPKGRIDHSVYGLGTVVEANEHHTTIEFDEAGTKKFVTHMVKLVPSETSAPDKPRKKPSARSRAPRKT